MIQLGSDISLLGPMEESVEEFLRLPFQQYHLKEDKILRTGPHAQRDPHLKDWEANKLTGVRPYQRGILDKLSTQCMKPR